MKKSSHGIIQKIQRTVGSGTRISILRTPYSVHFMQFVNVVYVQCVNTLETTIQQFVLDLRYPCIGSIQYRHFRSEFKDSWAFFFTFSTTFLLQSVL